MKRALFFLSLTGLLVAVVVQSRTTTALRREHDSLVSAARDAERLASENAEIPALRAEGVEVRRLRVANEELHALRNEFTQLRRVQPELVAQRAENERLRTEKLKGFMQPLRMSEMPGYVAKAALAPAGFATPEATVQTWFWAMREVDTKCFAECFSPDRRQEMFKGLETQSESQRAEFIREAQRMLSTGYRIAAKRAVSPNEVVVSIQAVVGGKFQPMTLKRYGDEWKIGP